MKWLGALVGVFVGMALGLFGPVAALGALDVGTGSYEDVLPLWLASVPGGLVLGAWGGYRAGASLTRAHGKEAA